MTIKEKLVCFLLASFLYVSGIAAQPDNSWKGFPEVIIQGYLDVFYAYDFNQPVQAQRQSFFFNHNRHNEFNLNQGMIGLGVDHAKYRASLAFHAGTYPNDNYSAEAGVLKNIYEAYLGLSLNRKNNLWLDAGIFGSHLGFESALSIDDRTLTRSLSAESSPYFLTGAKLSYLPNDTWEFLALVVNGWQRIQRVEGNSLPSFGSQIICKPKDGFLLNWSTFVGTDDPDATRRMRYFSNLFGQFQFTDKIWLLAGLDFGWQQESKGSSSYDTWYALSAIFQYKLAEKWEAAIRGEYYRDEAGVIIPSDTPDGFNTSGFSVNADYLPVANLAIRFEARLLTSKEDEFEKNGDPVTQNFFMVASIAYKLKKVFK